MAEIEKLEKWAHVLRVNTLNAVYRVKSGHLGGSFSAADMIAALYFHHMNLRPEEPSWSARDRFVLSKGHAAPVLYAALAQRGYFPLEELDRLRQVDSMLQGAPNLKIPGVDMSAGPLGQGLSAAVGMALAGKLDRKNYRVYTLLGDGEIEEGECWEAFMFANHYKLDNLCIMIDVNGLQIDGPTAKVMNSEPLDQKMDAFGFNTIICNGNSLADLEQAFILFDRSHGSGKPTCFLLHTTKGLGVSFMENAVDWHGKAPNDAEYDKAMAELRASYEVMEKEAERING